MKFSTIPAFVFTTALCTLAYGGLAAAQGQRYAPSVRRDFGGYEFDELLVRTGKKSSGSNKAATSASVQAVQKAQSARSQATTKKKADNAKIQAKAVPQVKANVKTFREEQKKKPNPPDSRTLNAASDRQKVKEQGRVATQARKDHKEAKGKEWAAKAKTPEQKAATKAAATARRADRKAKGEASPPNKVSTKAPPRSKEVKHNTNQRFQAAAQKLKDTQGLPARKDKIGVGKASTDGRAVRQSVFNSHLNAKDPVGRSTNKVPKQFNNRPYSATHGDATLAGKKPLPQNGKEYPVINNSPTGFTANNNKPGPLRTITYKQGGQRHAAVIGHDTTRGGDKDDHYVGKKI